MAGAESVVKFTSAKDLAQIENNSDLKKDENVKTFQEFNLPKFYVFNLLFSIFTFIIDLYFICRLAFIYSKNNEGLFFALTLVFIVIPALITTAFSMRWYLEDEDELNTNKRPRLWQRWTLRLFLLFLQMAPLLRYCDALYFGIRSKIAKKQGNHLKHHQYLRLMLVEDCDSCLLRLFSSFLQSCPQMVIHLVFILTHSTRASTDLYTDNYLSYQPYSIVCSLVAVAWSLTSYYRSHRAIQEEKEILSIASASVMFAWFHFNTLSRVLALALLATIYPKWFIIFCMVHWAVMFLWLVLGKQTTVCISHCEELLLGAALAVAYIFAFISPKDGPTRYSYLAYYLVCFIENTAVLVIWCVSNEGPSAALRYGAVGVQAFSFVLNVLFMITYYKFCHPSGTSVVIRKSVSLTGGKSSTL